MLYLFSSTCLNIQENCSLAVFKPAREYTISSRVVEGIAQAFRDNAVSEHTARHWFWKLRLGDLSLCDESHSSQPQVLDYDALRASIEEDNNQTSGELGKCFQVSDETVHHLLSKWVPYTLLEANE